MSRCKLKLLSILITMIYVFSIFPALVVNAGTITGTFGDNISWTLSDNGTLRISGSGLMGDCNYNRNYDVAPWFDYRNDITSVVIDDNIIAIGYRAFYECYNLTSVTIPDKVQFIGEQAFADCYNLTSVTIPYSISTIYLDAFEWCDSLTDIYYIGSMTRWNSINGPEQNIDPGCEAIEFAPGYSMSDIIGNATVHALLDVDDFFGHTGDQATFRVNYVKTGLSYQWQYYSNDAWNNSNAAGAKTSKLSFNISNSHNGMKYRCIITDSKGQSMTTNEATLIVLDNASGKCGDKLSWQLDEGGTLTITGSGEMTDFNSLSDIPWYEYSENIKSIVFSGNITSIGNVAFPFCTGITSISIPESVTRIGNNAFNGCYGLANVSIPDSVTEIGPYAFYRCISLEDITIPSSVNVIGNGAFSRCERLKKINLSEGLTSIGNYAFEYCYKLKRIVIPDSVTSIGKYAFNNCHNLYNVKISNSVTSIGEYTFSGCHIDYLTIPESLTSIDYFAFCLYFDINDGKPIPYNTIYEIDYGGSRDQWNQISVTGAEGIVDNFGPEYATMDYIFGNARINCAFDITTQPKDFDGFIGQPAVFDIGVKGEGLQYQWQYYVNGTWRSSGANGNKTSQITMNTTSDKEGMKYRCVVTDSKGRSLISDPATLHIVDSVSGICGENMTYTLDNSGTLTISGSGYMYFYSDKPDDAKSEATGGGPTGVLPTVNVKSYAPWKYHLDCIKKVVFNGDINSIASSAFANCNNLQSVTIPDSVTEIGSYAFCGCTSLSNVSIPGSVTRIDNFAFCNCTNLTGISLPDSVRRLGSYAFNGCTSLISVRLPSGLNSIYAGLFANCSSLKSITIPASVSSIGDNAFWSCSSLTNVTIPDGVYNLGGYSFRSCTSLKSISIPDTVTAIGYYSFAYCTALTDIYFGGTKQQFEDAVCCNLSDYADINVHYAVEPLKITKQPANYTGPVGSTASFSVTTNGTGLTYQWQVYSNGAWSNSGASGSKTNKISFNVAESHNGKKYRCVITDSYGQKVTSNAATVYVGTPLAITKQPVNYTGTAGSTATFSVTATGTGLTYQWQMYSDGAWKNSGATGSKTNKISFNVTSSHNGKKYRCVITDSFGQKVTSNAATVYVGTPLAITKQPVNYTGAVGSTATFSVTATGTGLTYQWQMYSDGAWKNSGATGSKTNRISFNVTDSHNGKKYRCVITDSNGQKVTSNAASVKVATPLTITKQPVNYIGAAGSTATFNVTASGTGLKYQWQVYSDGAWCNSGATGSKTSSISFNVNNNSNGKKYRCVITDSNGQKVTSNTVTVKVGTPLTITKQPVNYTGLAGSTATFSVTASGTGLTYQWQMYSDGAWKNSGAAGAKTNKISFTVTSSHNGMKYRCVITDSNGQKVTSDPATVRIGIQSTNYVDTVSDNATAPVTVTNKAMSGIENVEDGRLMTDIEEEANALINDRIDGVESEELEDKIQMPVLEEPEFAEEEEATETRLSLDGQQVIYSDGEEASEEVSSKGPSILKQPSEFKGKAGEKVTFTVEAEGQCLRYQWQYCKNGEWIDLDVEGADTAELILEITAADKGMQYRCIVTDFLGNVVITDVIDVLLV